MDAYKELEQAVEAPAMASLAARGLVSRAPIPAAAPCDGAVVADRTAGVVLGLAAGSAAPSGRVGIEAQTFVLAAEAWLDHGWRAPEVVAEQLSRELGTLRTRGAAITAAVRRRRAGTPWYLAASTSYGNGALARAAAAGAVFGRTPAAVPVAASVDAAVTHAERRATAASATLAAIVAGLIRRSTQTSPREVCEHVLRGRPDPTVGRRLAQAMAALDDDVDVRARRWGVRAADTLALAAWCALATDDPVDALARAKVMERGSHTAGAVTGAIVGAVLGAHALPENWRNGIEGAAHYPQLARRLVDADLTAGDEGDRGGADIWFLLDRSGSMQAIAGDVVTGFERFFAAQRELAGDATVTLVQFDGEDPHEVLVDAAPLSAVGPVHFEPRGMTPLYDAMGMLVDRAERRGGDDADQLVVILTDGEENDSRTWDRHRLFERIGALRARGWTFVFLGANQDSYAAGDAVGLHAGNVSDFRPDAPGVAAAYDGLSRTVGEWRSKSRLARRRDRDDFWGGRKEAEER